MSINKFNYLNIHQKFKILFNLLLFAIIIFLIFIILYIIVHLL